MAKPGAATVADEAPEIEPTPASGAKPTTDETPPISQVMFQRFLRAWIPVLCGLLLLELIGAPLTQRPELLTLVAFTAIAGVATFVAALGLSREQASRWPLVAAVLVDVAGILTGLLSSAGNDAAIMLPFLGAVLLTATFEDRELLAAFVIQWLVGMAGASASFLLSDLRLVPNADPVYVSLASSGVLTFVGYTMLWWVRERLNRAANRARAAEQAATRSAQALEALVRSSPVPTIGFDLAGRITTWNPAAESVLGWPASEILGQEASVLAAENDGPQATPVERVLRGEVVNGLRVPWRDRDGRTLVIDLHAALLQEADGQPTGVVTQAIDETDREALQARLTGAERLEAVGRLAGGIAHDFNNLLTAVTGYAELLQAELPGDAQSHEDAAEIGRAAARGSELVRQLLAFGRRQPIRPVTLDLDRLIDGLLPMLGRLIGSGVRIRVEPAAEPCFVRADAGQLEQVIVNLAVNARDAMPAGGDLLIRTTILSGEEVPRARLSVTDTGLGMDAATAAMVFEPFFTTKPIGGGSGLGLATVYGIVTAHGGSIDVQTRPGHGTTFLVDLPRIIVAAVAPDPPTDGEGRPTGGSETILVIDDEQQVREVASRALERLGYRVLQAGDEASALAAAGSEPGRIDIVLSDIVMPDVRGPALVARLRPIHPEMRVLYMTGFAADGRRDQLAPELDAPVLAKPFSLTGLAATLRGVLDEPDAAPR